MSFSRKLTSGAAILGGGQLARIVLTLLSTIVIARILLPEDYGIMAMVAPIVALTSLFQELGFSTATIQRKELSEEEINALFWFSQLATMALSVALVLLSPLVGLFYGDPRPAYVTAATSLSLIVSGLSLQQTALLNRDMKYGALSIADLANAFAAFAVTLGAALAFRSYWALVAGSFAGAAVQAVLCWNFSSWRPSRKPSIRAASSFLRFGGDMTAYNFLNFLVRNADNVLIARFAGGHALGLYDRSYRLMTMPMQNLNGPLWRLLLPALSRLVDDRERYRSAFLIPLQLLLLAMMPAFALATVLSDRVIVFLLGEAWGEAGGIFFWLALAGMFQPLSNLCGLLMVSHGRSGDMLRWGVFAAITTLGGFLAGLHFAGALGVAASIFFVGTLRAPLLYALAARATPVRQRDLYLACAAPLAGGAVGAALTIPLAHLPTAPLLIVCGTAAYGTALLGCLATAQGRKAILHVVEAILHRLQTIGPARNADA